MELFEQYGVAVPTTWDELISAAGQTFQAAFVLFFVFHTIPVLQGAFYSLTDSPGYGDWSFVGLSNYVALFSDDWVRAAYLFTFQFAIITTILVNAIALGLAVGLNSRSWPGWAS